MKIYIVIPAHNEAEFISLTLESLVDQTYPAEKIVVVNDQSRDNTPQIVSEFALKYPSVSLISISSSEEHLPGSKVIRAFSEGYKTLDEDFDVICKFDADLIFPKNYLEMLVEAFQKEARIGMFGGFCSIQKGNSWIVENLTDKDHIRGAIKAYRKECFQNIGGLKQAMGWDTADELLAQYYNWKIETDPKLLVKHLKPTGTTYNKASKYKQGEAFYSLRYGFLITLIASAKLAYLKQNFGLFKDYMSGYFQASSNNSSFLLTEDEGRFVRKLRWNKMKEKLF